MQTIYENGTILTMQDPLYAEAVFVDHGRVAAVGPRKEVLAAAKGTAERVDLCGRTLMPSFLDPHSHFTAAANARLQVSLDQSASFEDIARRIADFIHVNGVSKGEWVVAKGYDHNRLQERRHPDRALLDAAAPANPVMLQHQSGHVGVFNTMALERLNVTAQTSPPDGGAIGKAAGSLTGYMEENAFLSYQRQVPMPSAEAMLGAYRKAQEEYAANGITTLQEGMMVDQMVPMYKALLASGLLKLDLVGYADIRDSKLLFSDFSAHVKQYQDRFKISGFKIFLDGSPQGRTAWMRHPYQNAQDGYCGYGTMTDDQVFQAVRLAAQKGLQILAHCNGDAAAAQYIAACQRVAADMDLSALRPVMIHAQLIGTDQLHDVASLGLIPSFFIAHVFHWGDVHIENFGMERASHISPAGSSLKQGIRFTFHQDTPVVPPNMLETVWCAATRRTKNGTVLGKTECIPVLEALKAVTSNAAYQYFEEQEKGSIAPGKRADFVILDRDPLSVDPQDLRQLEVLETIKDGVVIYRKATNQPCSP